MSMTFEIAAGIILGGVGLAILASLQDLFIKWKLRRKEAASEAKWQAHIKRAQQG